MYQIRYLISLVVVQGIHFRFLPRVRIIIRRKLMVKDLEIFKVLIIWRVKQILMLTIITVLK